ncbi:MAG: c-type cytochrome [Vicinamibacterales bacterium]
MRGFLLKALVAGLAVAVLAGVRPLAQGNSEAAKLQNPVAASPESIAAGKVLYYRNCANCHGIDGEGSPGNDLTPPAPSITGKLKHGSTDGEIFETIRKGVAPAFDMAAFGQQGLKEQDIWNVVNYVRTLMKK